MSQGTLLLGGAKLLPAGVTFPKLSTRGRDVSYGPTARGKQNSTWQTRGGDARQASPHRTNDLATRPRGSDTTKEPMPPCQEQTHPFPIRANRHFDIS